MKDLDSAIPLIRTRNSYKSTILNIDSRKSNRHDKLTRQQSISMKKEVIVVSPVAITRRMKLELDSTSKRSDSKKILSKQATNQENEKSDPKNFTIIDKLDDKNIVLEDLLGSGTAIKNIDNMLMQMSEKLKKAPINCNENENELSGIGNMCYENLVNHIRNLHVENVSRIMRPILMRLFYHSRNDGIFNIPVDPVALGLHDYFKRISCPMDLGTIKGRLQLGHYNSIADVCKDILLVFDNATSYNAPSHFVHQRAVDVKKEFESEMKQLEEKLVKDAERKKLHNCSLCSGFSCELCGEKCLKYDNNVLVCSGSCAQKIKKNSPYYVTQDGSMTWCQKCHTSLPAIIIVVPNQDPINKRSLLKRKLDEEIAEPWVKCDFCSRWMHQVCALYNDCLQENDADDSKYACPLCKISGSLSLDVENIVSIENLPTISSCDEKLNSSQLLQQQECLSDVATTIDGDIDGESAVVMEKGLYDEKIIVDSSDFSASNGTCYESSYSDSNVSDNEIDHLLAHATLSSKISGPLSTVSHVQSQWKASYLPTTKLSEFLEEFIFCRIQSIGYGDIMKSLTIRVVSNVELAVEIPQPIVSNLASANMSSQSSLSSVPSVSIPSSPNLSNENNAKVSSSQYMLNQFLPYRQKCILLFQNIDGVDVCLYCLYVQEFDEQCPPPNSSVAYIAYLDSVDYFRPAEIRTTVYHEIMVGYIQWIQARGFQQCHIWSCPPQRGDNFIFWCHPSHQKTPSRDRLNSWYNSILSRCKQLGFVEQVTSLYDAYFQSSSITYNRSEVMTRKAALNSFVGSGKVSKKLSSDTLQSVSFDSTCDSISVMKNHVTMIPLSPPVFDGDFWVLEFLRLHKNLLNRQNAVNTKDIQANLKRLKDLMKELMSCSIASPFNQPVDHVALNIPSYPLTIKYPMDLGTIRNKLRAELYNHVLDLFNDVILTFNNAITFNPSGNPVHIMAKAMLKNFEISLRSVLVFYQPDFSQIDGDLYCENTKNLMQSIVLSTLNISSTFADDNEVSVAKSMEDIAVEENQRLGLTRTASNLSILSTTSNDFFHLSNSTEENSKFGVTLDEEDNRLQRSGSFQSETDSTAPSDLSVWPHHRPFRHVPNCVHSNPSMVSHLKPMPQPEIGFKGISALMYEVGKSVQRMKDDLFVVKLSSPSKKISEMNKRQLHDSSEILEESSKRPKLSGDESRSDDVNNAESDSIESTFVSNELIKEEESTMQSTDKKNFPRRSRVRVPLRLKATKTVNFSIPIRSSSKFKVYSSISEKCRFLLKDIQADTSDPDQLTSSNNQDQLRSFSLTDMRHSFLEFCQFKHYQFDTLRRAKYSSMMLLYHLHNPNADNTKPKCIQCKNVLREIRYHCEQCPSFDMCQQCLDSNSSNKCEHEHMLTPFRISFI